MALKVVIVHRLAIFRVVSLCTRNLYLIVFSKDTSGPLKEQNVQIVSVCVGSNPLPSVAFAPSPLLLVGTVGPPW